MIEWYIAWKCRNFRRKKATIALVVIVLILHFATRKGINFQMLFFVSTTIQNRRRITHWQFFLISIICQNEFWKRNICWHAKAKIEIYKVHHLIRSCKRDLRLQINILQLPNPFKSASTFYICEMSTKRVQDYLVSYTHAHPHAHTHACNETWKRFFFSISDWKNTLNRMGFCWQIPQKNIFTRKQWSKQTSLWMKRIGFEWIPAII